MCFELDDFLNLMTFEFRIGCEETRLLAGKHHCPLCIVTWDNPKIASVVDPKLQKKKLLS
jgi:hypothetical protein